MYKNSWKFDIKALNGGKHLETLVFYGVDSEEAHTTCIEWAEKQYDCSCIANLVDGEIERNEKRRAQKELEKGYSAKEFAGVIIRKIKTVKTIEEF